MRILLAVFLMQSFAVADDLVIYGTENDRKCANVQADFRGGAFADLQLNVKFVDKRRAPRDVTHLPSYRINGGSVFTVGRGKPYDRQALREELQRRLKPFRPEPPKGLVPYNHMADVESKRRDDAGDVLPPADTAESGDEGLPVFREIEIPVERPVHVEQRREVVEPKIPIDWSGVRFGVLVPADSSKLVTALRGPVQRLLDTMSGNRLQLEPIAESVEPERYQAVADALGVEGAIEKVHPFMTFDKVADVGAVKGVILSKIEKTIGQHQISKSISLVPDFVFRRSDSRTWESVTGAMGPPNLGPYEGRGGIPSISGLVSWLLTWAAGHHWFRGGLGLKRWLAARKEQSGIIDGLS